MIYGSPRYRIEEDQVDRDGVRRVIIARSWQPSRPGLSNAEILAERPPAPSFDLPLSGPIITTQQSGYLETQWIFEGSGDDETSLGYPQRTRELSKNSTFTPIMADVELTRHPLWPEYQKDHGAKLNKETGRIEWPEHLSIGNDSGNVGLTQARHDVNLPLNPMYGRQTYLHLTGGTYSHSYIAKKRPPGLFSRLSDIFKTSELPGEPPELDASERRDWLKIIPDCQQHEDYYAITEHYLLSDIGGHPPQIYPPRAPR